MPPVKSDAHEHCSPHRMKLLAMEATQCSNSLYIAAKGFVCSSSGCAEQVLLALRCSIGCIRSTKPKALLAPQGSTGSMGSRHTEEEGQTHPYPCVVIPVGLYQPFWAGQLLDECWPFWKGLLGKTYSVVNNQPQKLHRNIVSKPEKSLTLKAHTLKRALVLALPLIVFCCLRVYADGTSNFMLSTCNQLVQLHTPQGYKAAGSVGKSTTMHKWVGPVSCNYSKSKKLCKPCWFFHIFRAQQILWTIVQGLSIFPLSKHTQHSLSRQASPTEIS